MKAFFPRATQINWNITYHKKITASEGESVETDTIYDYNSTYLEDLMPEDKLLYNTIFVRITS